MKKAVDIVTDEEDVSISVRTDQFEKSSVNPFFYPLATGDMPQKEEGGPHDFVEDMTRICTCCHTCTSQNCYRKEYRPDDGGLPCGCGRGDSGCRKCGQCSLCARGHVCPGSAPSAPEGVRYRMAQTIPLSGCRVRRQPTVSSEQVGSIEWGVFPQNYVHFLGAAVPCSSSEKEGNSKSVWYKLSPSMYYALEGSYSFVDHDRVTEGFVRQRHTHTGLDLFTYEGRPRARGIFAQEDAFAAGDRVMLRETETGGMLWCLGRPSQGLVGEVVGDAHNQGSLSIRCLDRDSGNPGTFLYSSTQLRHE